MEGGFRVDLVDVAMAAVVCMLRGAAAAAAVGGSL
jgi:hypothetical protein